MIVHLSGHRRRGSPIRRSGVGTIPAGGGTDPNGNGKRKGSGRREIRRSKGRPRRRFKFSGSCSSFSEGMFPFCNFSPPALTHVRRIIRFIRKEGSHFLKIFLSESLRRRD